MRKLAVFQEFHANLINVETKSDYDRLHFNVNTNYPADEFKNNYILFSDRPPTFKQSTPSSRTNMKQLLWREQCMENERRRQRERETVASVQIPASSAQPEAGVRFQDIPTEVYKVQIKQEMYYYCFLKTNEKTKQTIVYCIFLFLFNLYLRNCFV